MKKWVAVFFIISFVSARSQTINPSLLKIHGLQTGSQLLMHLQKLMEYIISGKKFH
jgi:hypothetical protein